MTHRFLAFVGVVGILVAVVWLVPVTIAAQAPAAAVKATAPAKAWTGARTPDGQPDLQGFWTNGSYTPLERPDNVTKEFYTKEEAVEFEKRFVDNEAEQTVPGTIPDVHYDHTQFGLERSIGGYTSNLRTSLIVDPSNGKLPPLSAEGQKRAAERAEARKRMGGPYDAAENLPLGSRCLFMDRVGPPMLSGNYNNNYQIVQAPGYAMLLTEMLHDVRMVPLDGRPHLPQNIRQWTGSYIGHWEGETLVVETTNLNGKYSFRGSSENMRVIERFTRTSEDGIRYQFTIDDPSTWTRPWSAELTLKKTVGPLFEHACHEGNYGLYNILAGARAEEKRAEEAVKKGSKQ
jgi:hypothetical protein